MRIGMGLKMGMYLFQRPEQRLTAEQKLQLTQILKLEQKLREPGVPEATRGLEGLLLADQILKQKGAVGFLIGGLGKSVWRGNAQLGRHKDVDVLVMTKGTDFEKFEGGIDWWLPTEDQVSGTFVGGYIENYAVRYWANENGVVLTFNIEQTLELPPGLHILLPHHYAAMKLAEAVSSVGSGAGLELEIDSDFEATFQKKLGLTETLHQRIGNQIHVCQDSAFKFSAREQPIRVAINQNRSQKTT